MDHVNAYRDDRRRIGGLVANRPSSSEPLSSSAFVQPGGRRSQDQIGGLDWSGDSEKWRRHIVMPSYQAPDEPVIE